MPSTASTASYVTSHAHSGARSARLGLLPGSGPLAPPTSPEHNLLGETAPLGATYSTAYQTIHIPAGIDAATLSFWYLPGTQASSGDWQRLVLLRPSDFTRIEELMRVQENNNIWKYTTFDLTSYQGRDLVLYFEVYNNSTGSSGRTWMYVDDVSVLACTGPTPTPTPVPYRLWMPLTLH